MLDMLIQKIVDFILDLFGINTKHEENKDKNINNKVNNYIKRNFMTSTEMIFYNKIKELNDEYIVIPQVNLVTIIEKKTKGYRNLYDICKNANIKLITFYTKYPNEKNWVLNRIKNEISSQRNTKTEDTNIISYLF